MEMFRDCTSLVNAPQLPATTMIEGCYEYMFQGCTSLTQAPELPATSLVQSCYIYMFKGCTSLNSIKIGYTGGFISTYFSVWVAEVAQTGILYYNGSDITTGISAIPSGWTVQPF